MWHIQERQKTHAGSSWRNLKERDPLEDLGVDDRILLKNFLNKWNGMMRAVLIWLMTGTNVWLL
jgi:hypothetical protein